MTETEYAIPSEEPLAPPPPPVQKPPTLASLIIAVMREQASTLETMDITIDGMWVEIGRALTMTRTLLIATCALFSLSLLVSIATLVLAAFLLGHVR